MIFVIRIMSYFIEVRAINDHYGGFTGNAIVSWLYEEMLYERKYEYQLSIRNKL